MTTTPMAIIVISTLENTIKTLTTEFDLITESRRKALEKLTGYIAAKVSKGEVVNLNFICTHNSRRSHMGQLWAQAAATYYNIPGVISFSGGTEATAFNPRAVKAMQEAGFEIKVSAEGQNPEYAVSYATNAQPVKVFSKKYNDPFNPEKGFAAIMTCSDADENCPIVTGAEWRLALTYDDPKNFDGTSQEEEKYRERVHQIGREILYTFSRIKV